MSVARTTDGSAPTTAAKPSTATMPLAAAARRPPPAARASVHTAPASSATLNPETASTWNTPALRNASCTSAGSAARLPSTSPPSSPADTGGSRSPNAASANLRTRAGHGGAGGSSGTTRVDDALPVTWMPSRAIRATASNTPGSRKPTGRSSRASTRILWPSASGGGGP